MEQILFTWIGNSDLKAMNGKGEGAIDRAIRYWKPDRIILLSDHPTGINNRYKDWQKRRTDAKIELPECPLSDPDSYHEIYKAAKDVVGKYLPQAPDYRVAFHLGAGTGAMGFVWILLSETLYPADLIQTARRKNPITVELPFELTTVLLSDLITASEERFKDVVDTVGPENPEFEAIIRDRTNSKLNDVIRKASRIAKTIAPVLIEGESGTGKELFAKAIHQCSGRKEKKFVSLNCAAIPAELVESILFGAEKGAATGVDRRIGYFEAADGGTLFLDEIGELPLPAQAKLLRALETGQITRVGSTHEKEVDVRIVTATNRNLAKMSAEGKFRLDLMHRIAVAILKLPPIRDRHEDLFPIIDHMMHIFNKESLSLGFGEKRLSRDAKRVLRVQTWPGNIRELKNTLYRAVINCEGKDIREGDIRDALFDNGDNSPTLWRRSAEGNLDLAEAISEIARDTIQRALKKTGGNITKAAMITGLKNHQTFRNWMRKYGIDDHKHRPS